MACDRRWCKVTLVAADGTPLARIELAGAAAPDLAVVDELAWMALLAARAGGSLALEAVAPALRELLELAGLLQGVRALVEVDGQPEEGEEPLGVEEGEEEAQRGDLPA
jgi:hypothetical protein